VLHFYSPDFVGSDVGQSIPLHGHPGLRNLFQIYWRAFPDLRIRITDRVVEKSRLVILWEAEGTHQGPILNIPPTGHKARVRGMAVIEIENGLVVHGQSVWDLAGMLRDLGLLPELKSTDRAEAAVTDSAGTP
jgi:steroid delta-isomerase-like uncharacterized protein